MHLVLNPNPSIDQTAEIGDFKTGRLFHIPGLLRKAGGKGFNVARALLVLGDSALVVGPAGGHAGRALLDLAAAEGLDAGLTWIEGETRSCLAIVDPVSGQVTQVNESGPHVGAGDWVRVLANVESHLASAFSISITGSFPPGTPYDVVRTLAAMAQRAGVPLVLDTYGPQLSPALDMQPDIVKINRHEAAGELGFAVNSPEDGLLAARELQRRGARAAVITLGRIGAVGCDEAGNATGWAAPRVGAVSSVGSGDSLLAGVLAGLHDGSALSEAVRLGVVSGAANTLQLGAAVFTRQQVEELLPLVRPLPS